MKTKLIIIGGLLLFLISPQITVAAPLDLPLTTSSAPMVSSTTHPDSSEWYPKSDLTVSWTRPDDAYGFSFKLDQVPDTIPDDTLDTTITTTKTFTELEDGVWYFHVKSRPASLAVGFGETTHFKVQIDTTAPEAFQLNLVTTEGSPGPTKTPTISFATTDTGSGIDRYQVFLAGQEVAAEASSPYTFAPIKFAASHPLKVTAWDMAGNSRSASLVVEVPPGFSPSFLSKTMTLPVYELVALNILILLLFILILLLIYRRQQVMSSEPLAPTLAFPLSETKSPVVKKAAKPRKRTVRRKPTE